MKDPLDKIFMGKIQSKWFNKGRRQVLKEIQFYLKENKYPVNSPIRKMITDKLFALHAISKIKGNIGKK